MRYASARQAALVAAHGGGYAIRHDGEYLIITEELMGRLAAAGRCPTAYFMVGGVLVEVPGERRGTEPVAAQGDKISCCVSSGKAEGSAARILNPGRLPATITI